MRVYSGKIRLNGDLRWEVQRDRMTAPEVMILRALHGVDAVVGLKYIDDLDDAEISVERERLEREYVLNPSQDGNIVAKLFGAHHMSLPIKAPNAPEAKEGVVEKPAGKKLRAEDLAA